MNLKLIYTKVVLSVAKFLTQHVIDLGMPKQSIEVNEDKLAQLLLVDALQKAGPQIGLADLNDYSLSKVAWMQKIRDMQHLRSKVLDEVGYIGAIKRTSSVEEDLKVAREYVGVSPTLLKELEHEEAILNLQEEIKEHWQNFPWDGSHTYEDYKIAHDQLLSQFNELTQTKIEEPKGPDRSQYGDRDPHEVLNEFHESFLRSTKEDNN